MRFQHLKLPRVFLFLLLTIFITHNVYAGGMMIAVQDSEGQSEHHHQMQPKVADAGHHTHLDGYSTLGNDENKTQDHHKHSSGANCSSCNHCFACFTMLPFSEPSVLVFQAHGTLISLFKSIYLSPTSEQPQRPPIL